MTIGQMRKYLKNFKDDQQVVVGGWFPDGRRYYMPKAPACPPVSIKSESYGDVAVIGFFDNCAADTVKEVSK